MRVALSATLLARSNPIEEAFSKIESILRKAEARARCIRAWLKRWVLLRSERSPRRTHGASSNIAATPHRFNCYDRRCIDLLSFLYAPKLWCKAVPARTLPRDRGSRYGTDLPGFGDVTPVLRPHGGQSSSNLAVLMDG